MSGSPAARTCLIALQSIGMGRPLALKERGAKQAAGVGAGKAATNESGRSPAMNSPPASVSWKHQDLRGAGVHSLPCALSISRMPADHLAPATLRLSLTPHGPTDWSGSRIGQAGGQRPLLRQTERAEDNRSRRLAEQARGHTRVVCDGHVPKIDSHAVLVSDPHSSGNSSWTMALKCNRSPGSNQASQSGSRFNMPWTLICFHTGLIEGCPQQLWWGMRKGPGWNTSHACSRRPLAHPPLTLDTAAFEYAGWRATARR